MASKLVFLMTCAVACVRAGNLIAPAAEIRYAAPAPIVHSQPLAYAQYSAPAPIVRTSTLVQPAPVFRSAPATLVQSAPIFRSGPTFVHQAAAPILKSAPVIARAEEYDPNPQYSFGYDVHDSLTGDVKSQSESRNGDAVQGSYALNEPDGTRRIVDYTADPVNGFNAVVRREPIGEAALVKAAPIAGAPVAYGAAPVLKTTTYVH